MRLQLQHPAFRGVCYDSHLDGLHQIRRGFLILRQLLFHGEKDIILPGGFIKSAISFGDRIDHIVLHDIVPDRLDNLPLYLVPDYILFLASAFLSASTLAAIIIVELTVLPGAADTDHRLQAVPAEEFPGEHIVSGAVSRLAGGVFLGMHFSLYLLENVPVKNRGNASIDPDGGIFIDSQIHLIVDHGVKAVFIPLPADSCFDPAIIKVSSDIRI